MHSCRRSTLWVALFIALLTRSASAQGLDGPGFAVDYDSVEFRMTPVAGRVHMLAGAGGNLGVFVADDGVFLVDSQFAPLTERIRAEIGRLTSQPVRFLINTHFHGDHTGGNENFGPAGAVIVAQENVRRTLAQPHYIEMVHTRWPAFSPQAPSSRPCHG